MTAELSRFALYLDQTQPLGWWVYLLLGILAIVEGPLITLAAAVASSAGYLNPVFVFIATSCGNLTADILWYFLGYMGKREWLSKYGSWFGIKESFLAQIHEDIQAHIGKILFAAKLTLGLVIPTLVAAGLARVPMRRWLGTLILAESVWTGGLVLAGYYFGQYMQNFVRDIRWLSFGGGAILLFILIFYLSRRRTNPKSEQS